jgi:hypothetical protein
MAGFAHKMGGGHDWVLQGWKNLGVAQADR